MLWWKPNLSHSPVKLFCWYFCHTPAPTCISSVPLLALNSLQAPKLLNLPCSLLLGSQPVIRQGWSNGNMKEIFLSAALIIHFLLQTETQFLLQGFLPPWAAGISSWTSAGTALIHPGPRHKSLQIPSCSFQEPADLHQALTQQCISFMFTRKQSFCGHRRKDNKASFVIFSSTVMWRLTSGLSPASPAGRWASGHRGGWTMLPLQGSVGAVTQSFTTLRFWKVSWKKECSELGFFAFCL